MKLIKSEKTGLYRVRIATDYGHRTINTGTRDREEAVKIIRAANIPELERAGRSVRLSNEVVQQIRFGKAIKSSEAMARWEEHLKLYARSPKTTHNKLCVVRVWLREQGLADTPAHLLKPADIDTWINDPESKDMASTRTLKLCCIRAFFAWCASQQFTLGDPTTDLHVRMDGLRHAQKEPKKQRAFTDEEFGRLMAHCAQEAARLEAERQGIIRTIEAAEAQGCYLGALADRLMEKAEAVRVAAFWHLAALIGRHTGLRLGDVCRLELDSVDVGTGRITVWTGKTDKRVSLPMPQELQTALSAWPGSSPPFLFPKAAALYEDVERRSMLSGAFIRLAAAAGAGHHGFHDLRHTYASACRAAGIPTPHISQRLGHTNTTTTEIYLETP